MMNNNKPPVQTNVSLTNSEVVTAAAAVGAFGFSYSIGFSTLAILSFAGGPYTIAAAIAIVAIVLVLQRLERNNKTMLAFYREMIDLLVPLMALVSVLEYFNDEKNGLTQYIASTKSTVDKINNLLDTILKTILSKLDSKTLQALTTALGQGEEKTIVNPKIILYISDEQSRRKKSRMDFGINRSLSRRFFPESNRNNIIALLTSTNSYLIAVVSSIQFQLTSCIATQNYANPDKNSTNKVLKIEFFDYDASKDNTIPTTFQAKYQTFMKSDVYRNMIFGLNTPVPNNYVAITDALLSQDDSSRGGTKRVKRSKRYRNNHVHRPRRTVSKVRV